MTSNTCTSEAARPGRPATAGDLARLVECVRQSDRLVAEAATLAGRLAGSGVCERVEGLPLEQFASVAARMTNADARNLVRTGQVLEAMPVTRVLFETGRLGWGQVRAMVSACAALSRADRRVVDERVAATVAAYEPGAAAFDPDGLVWAVEAAVEELRPRETERAERRQVAESFLARQMDFDGGMRLHGLLDPLSAAVVNNAIDAGMGPLPAGSGQPCDEADPDSEVEGAGTVDESVDGGGGVGEVEVGRWSGRRVGKAAARALVDVCAQWLGGGPGRRARPLLVARVDLAQVSASPSGTVELSLRGPLPRIGAATLERLAHDADFKAVLFDGQRPLAVSRQVNLADISRRTRLAVETRDGGCRWPASPDPIAFTDLDHIIERRRGAITIPTGWWACHGGSTRSATSTGGRSASTR